MEETLKGLIDKQPHELTGEPKKLFEAIMKIADERDELKKENEDLLKTCKEQSELIEDTYINYNDLEFNRLKRRNKELEKENIRLKYQDIPYLEGTIKGYKARIEELKVNQCDHNISNECIRKSVIRDKLKIARKHKQKADNTIKLYTLKQAYGFREDVFEEILREE